MTKFTLIWSIKQPKFSKQTSSNEHRIKICAFTAKKDTNYDFLMAVAVRP